MSAKLAKQTVASILGEQGIHYEKLTARKVSFSDLARGEGYFVKPHGLELPDPRLAAVKDILKKDYPGLFLDV